MASIQEIIGSLLQSISGGSNAQEPVVSPLPDEPAKDSGKTKEKVLSFYKSKMPKSEKSSLEEYYPALQNLDDIMAKEELRPGAGVLGALQAFYESTGGRATSNLFGVKPKGKVSKFGSNKEAIDYQYGPNVLGGGANPKMNVLGKNTSLTEEDIRSLYDAYNPEGAYLSDLLAAYRDITKE